MSEYKDNLTWAAKPDIFKKAKDLRKSMTEAEDILWKHIRNNIEDVLSRIQNHL